MVQEMKKHSFIKTSIVYLVCGGPLALSAGCGKQEETLTGDKARKDKAGAEADLADGGVLDHDKEPPPPPPTGRPVIAYREGKAEEMREPQAVNAGLTVIDLSNYWTPYIFSERDSEEEERKPNDFRPIFRKLSNDWHYESRTRQAAREIVERRIARSRANKIFQLRQEGVSDEDIRERLGLDQDAETDPKKLIDAGTVEKVDEEEDKFEGGLGEAENFLEVYGIPPSLSVLRRRALEEIGRECYKEVDYDAIRRYDGFVAYKSTGQAKEDSRGGRRFARKLRQEMERLGVTDPLELEKHPKAKASAGLINQALRYEALAAAQKLLACEGLFEKGQENNYWSGGLDWKTHQALLAFEHKNRIFGWGFFGRETLDALKRTPEERLFDAFMRVLSERITDATHVIEDGSARDAKGNPFKYKDKEGKEREVRNLVAELTASTLRHMGLGTPDKVIEFLKSHEDDSLDRLFVAVPLPEKPPYYSDIMELRAEIDRGDVWYDYPYTEDGRHRTFPRERMPKTTLFVRWNEQDIPLVTMNTTIGGWRTELAPDGYEYYKYKNSDVGERVWKDIVAGPVWLPPETTPGGDLVKKITYRGREITVPNYDEFGPWYASAYGLVAAFHVRAVTRKSGDVAYFDNGIRSHGSVDYNSILRRFSHGCHRLYNHLAIRLFNFVLRHRPFVRVGQVPAGYSHKVVTEEGEEIIINLNSKGYKYELKAPVPVNVLPGRIRGRQKTPIETYMPKPEEEYGADAQFLPEGYLRSQVEDAGVSEGVGAVVGEKATSEQTSSVKATAQTAGAAKALGTP